MPLYRALQQPGAHTSGVQRRDARRVVGGGGVVVQQVTRVQLSAHVPQSDGSVLAARHRQATALLAPS